MSYLSATTARYVLALCLGGAIAGFVIAAQNASPMEVLETVISASVGSPWALLDMLRWAAPLTLSGLAFAVAFRSGVFNIGVEGQIYVGAFVAAIVGRYVDAPHAILPMICIVAAVLAGMLWTLPVAVLHRAFGLNEVVATLMMNYVAVLFCNLLTRTVFIASGSQTLATEPIVDAASLPKFSAMSDAGAGIVIAYAVTAVAAVVFGFTRYGIAGWLAGRSPGFTRFSGLSVSKLRFQAFLISGGLAGLAGALEITGILGRYVAGSLDNIGFTGILVSLMGLNSPIGIVLSGLFFGMLKNSELAISQIGNLSSYLVTLVSACFVLIFATNPLKRFVKA